MFQIKDFVSIVAGMINRAKATQNKLTDFNIGSVARTMLEAPAVEIDELYQQMWNGLKESIPVAIYNSFEFSPLPASASTGMVRVTITSSAENTLIVGGTKFVSNDGAKITFVSVSDATILAGGTYVDLKLVAVAPGISGNIYIGTTFSVTPVVAGLISAVSLSGFTNGADAEGMAERKVRFINYIATLNRGTVSAVIYGAKLAGVKNASGVVIESVKSIVVIEPWLTDPGRPVALVECYIYNGVNGASADLIADVLKVINGYVDTDGVRIPGWKAAGVKVDVFAATLVPTSVTASVYVAANYSSASVVSSVIDAVSDYITNLDVGADVILAEIVSAAMLVDGVENFHLTLPAADVVIQQTHKATVGTLTITSA